MSLNSNKRTYLDPIHQDIVLDRHDPAEALIIDLIDAPEFQRLRRVQQLGVTSFTFQGAENSRFTHSVGVMHVANRLFSNFVEARPELAPEKPLVLASALLHDLGHGPFSHVTEKILGYDHEDWSCRILSGDTEINRILKSYEHDAKLPEKIVSVLKKTYSPKFVSHMVSSQLDCDRFDYLLRDSYMTGTAYGMFALQRIISSLHVEPEEERIIVVGEKGQAAVEDYLFARYSMYAQVYYHKKNLAARALLGKLLKRAKYLIESNYRGDFFLDDATRKWLIGSELSVEEYLSLDDVQLYYHIKRWAKGGDQILADLSGRFLGRRLFKSLRIPREDVPDRASLEEKARKLAAAENLDPDYYVTIESTGFRPYDFYRPDSNYPQTNIMVSCRKYL
jgi:HD superfamily phosphohydrolase